MKVWISPYILSLINSTQKQIKMSHPNLQSEVKSLQIQIKNKEELFYFGIRDNREFDEMKKLHLEIKELKNLVNVLLEKKDQSQCQ